MKKIKKVKYNFKKIQEGIINDYGFVELPLQKVGTAKSNEHDEFVARLSEYKMDPEKVFQAGSNGKVPHDWATHVMRAGTVGEVIHHSLNEDGYIATYDVKWEDGTIEKNVPASLVEKMNSEMHEHEIDDDESDDDDEEEA